MSRYQVHVVDEWTPDDQEPIGSKAKEWLRGPQDRRWLFKEVRGQGRDRPPEGEDWAEKVVAELALLLGIPAAKVELAIRRGRRGIISLSVLDDLTATLVHGDELLTEVDPTYDRTQRGVATGMTVVNVRQALQGVGAAPGSPATMEGAGAWGSMASYLLLDALVANTDRHHENWAVIRHRVAPQVMAPSFDHASSLGFNEPPERCLARLRTADAGFGVRAYAERGRAKFEGRPPLVDLALEAVSLLEDGPRQVLRNRLEDLSLDACVEVLERIPAALMSQPSRTFAVEILRINRERLFHGLDRN